MALEATKELCFLCFEALQNAVSGKSSTKVSSVVVKPTTTTCGLFVTWKIGPRHDLRGCIGNFEPLPLYDGLQQFAVIAGTRDFRFSPITANELSGLECGVSLLHTFEPGKDVFDWEVGKHGIRLFLEHASATFLPEVAGEQGWDKDTTLEHLARKGGYRGKLTPEVLKKARLERYQSAKCKASWEEYQAWLAAH